MKKTISSIIIALALPICAQASEVDEHNFVNIGWSSVNEDANLIPGTTAKITGFGVNVRAEKSFDGLAYVGISYMPSASILMDISNTTDFVDGTASSFSIFVGSEKDFGGVILLGELSSSSVSTDTVYHATFGADSTSSTTSSGLNGILAVILPLESGRITGSLDMGLSGDFADSPTTYGVSYRSRFKSGFAELGFGSYSDKDRSGTTLGGSIGYYF